MNSEITTERITRIQTLAAELDQLGRTAIEKAIEAGNLLRECKESLAHGDWLPWLKSNFSFTDRTARRWMQVAECRSSGRLDNVSDLTLSEAYRITRDPDTPVPRISHNSGENEWYSPPILISKAVSVMGGIDLDPASSKVANQTVRAARFISKDEDGLRQKWKGRIWINPPYEQPLIDQFIDKLVRELQDGNITSAVALVNNATETKWFQKLATIADSICFPKARIRFIGPDGKPRGSPLQGQAILYFGGNAEGFAAEFRSIGFISNCEKYQIDTLPSTAATLAAEHGD